MLSIFTGLHTPGMAYIEQAYDSVRKQANCNWEWVIVPNGGAMVPSRIAEDDRVRIVPFTGDVTGVGQIKHHACQHTRGDILIELDADDLLVPGALSEIAAAFEDPTVQFAYSNNASFDADWTSLAFSESYGWTSRPFIYEGHELIEHIAWEPSAHSLRYVFHAPDHVRAWRASAYHALGGHNVEMPTCDDHELLIRTYLTYGARGMRHIDECLYLYRLHDTQTYRTRNAEIQEATHKLAFVYTQRLAERWARDEGLRRIDLGGGLNGEPGYQTVDVRQGADYQADLNADWPLEDNGVGVLRASHVVEHLRDPIHTMNEAYRVLAPGGFFLIDVPSTDGRGAFQDPTHVSFWNENSFWYYTRSNYAGFIPAFTGKFQASFVRTYYPDAWWQEHRIPVVRADLIALKPPYSDRPPGGALL